LKKRGAASVRVLRTGRGMNVLANSLFKWHDSGCNLPWTKRTDRRSSRRGGHIGLHNHKERPAGGPKKNPGRGTAGAHTRRGKGRLGSTLCGEAQAWAGRSWLLPLYGTAVWNGAGSGCGEKIQDRLQLNLRTNRLDRPPDTELGAELMSLRMHRIS
jgi:hypothetical protein